MLHYICLSIITKPIIKVKIMSNTLDLLETNDFQTEPINLNGIITLIDSETKELVNLVEISSLPEVSPPVTSPPVPPVLVTPDNIMYFEKDSRFF